MNPNEYVLVVPTNKEAAPTPFSRATARAIKTRIDALGVSHAAVARKSGLSANYLNERLREEKSFTLSDIERLGNYFGFDPAEFMCSVEVPAENNVRPIRPNVGGFVDDALHGLDTAAGTDETQADE